MSTATYSAHDDAVPHGAAHAEHDHKPSFFVRWFFSTNHKDIGLLYIMFAIHGGADRGAALGPDPLELAEPGIQVFAAGSWLSTSSAHHRGQPSTATTSR